VAGGAEIRAAALEGAGEPAAVLPIRLNADALSDLVTLRGGRSAPILTLTAPEAIFTVTNTSNSGAGSLRDAITQANATPGADTINFSIGSGLQTINLTSPLPAITETVAINGATQPGFAGAPLIVLNGSGAGITANGLVINAANCAIRSLVINGFGHVGVVMSGAGVTGNIVQGCYIGTNAAGTAAVPNGADPNSFDIDGIDILGGANSNTIGGTAAGARNLISGNIGDGVFIANAGANNNLVQGNYIGTDVTGAFAIGNGFAPFGTAFGVELATGSSPGPQGNIIGGTAAGAGNLVSGNAGSGVGIFNPDTNNNLVQGNIIGANAAGTAAVPNGAHGAAIANPPGGAVSAKNNLIGGTTPAARNLISGNLLDGVLIAHAGTNNNLVQGNYIGTNPAGAAALPNAARGVEIAFGAQGNTVGGTVAGARNLLSGNNNDGAAIFNPGTTGNFVQGNYIGTNAAGTAAVPNGTVSGFHGVEIAFGAQANTVGGTALGAGNLISGNASAGVGIFIRGRMAMLCRGISLAQISPAWPRYPQGRRQAPTAQRLRAVVSSAQDSGARRPARIPSRTVTGWDRPPPQRRQSPIPLE
jgi:titin